LTGSNFDERFRIVTMLDALGTKGTWKKERRI
jgi:hypothetical protein